MARQVPFTKYEAALLLDSYLKVVSGEASRKNSIIECSRLLRLMAINSGSEIDEKYRNVDGITFQMASMESAYKGKTIMKPATKLFAEIVALYRTDNDYYKHLLEEAKSMANVKQNTEAMFMSWLSENVSSAQLSELYLALHEIEGQAKKIKLIRTSLYENLDLSTVKKLRANIEQSKIFRFTHKRQWSRILSALSYLQKFANEENSIHTTSAVAEQRVQQEVTPLRDNPAPMDTCDQVTESTESIDNSTDGTTHQTIGVIIPNTVESHNAAAIAVENVLKKKQITHQYYQYCRNAFSRWLKEDQHMAAGSCRSYVSSIRSAERFAEDHGLVSKKLYTDRPSEAKATADALFEDPEFIQYNNDQHNRFRASITKLLLFYGIDWGTTVRTTSLIPSKKEPPSIDATPYTDILIEHFPKGYRLNSTLDMKRLRRYYEAVNGKEMTAEQSEVEEAIRPYGIIYDGRLYMPQTMLSDELRERVLSFVENCFEEGRSVVYYEALFREFSEEFLDQHIYNSDMLKLYLAYYLADKYYVGRSYLSKESQADIDPIDEIRQCLKEHSTPIQVDELCETLPHIASDRIRVALGSNGEFVRNSKGEYFHADSLELTDEELENIAAIIDNSIEEHEFISGNELYDAVRAKYPYTFEKNSAFSAIGWRDALKYKFNGRFSFVGNIISKAGTELSMGDVFADYAKGRERFTLNELEQFADSIGSTIYFDSLYINAIRISHEVFMPKHSAEFTIQETDSVIGRFCTGNYIPLSKIKEFATFPEASFPWTEYLLEQYAAFFSEKFCLMHGNYNKNCAVGAIVRKTGKYESFDDLVIDILSSSDVPLHKKEVLDYLAKTGYIARRSYTNIESLIISARAKRNQKES